MPIPDAIEEIAKARTRAKAELAKAGYELPQRPTYEIPRLPTNLADRDDQSIMALLARFVRYQDHLHGQVVVSEIDERVTEQLLEIAKARSTAQNFDSHQRADGTSNARVQIAKAEAALTTEVLDLQATLIQRQAKRKLMTVLFDSATRDANAVSREISRRIGREPTERRDSRRNP
jgi:hypothetical protein